MLKKKLKKAISVFQWLLTTVLVLVVLLLIFTAFNPIKSFQIFRVMSGSMEPKIKVGSVVFVQKVKPEILKENDVITYASLENPDISITHRLVEVEEKEEKSIFKTRGDANNSDDIAEVSPSQIKGKVVFSLPFLGYLSVWIRKPLGFGLLVILPALLIIISEILNIKKAIEKEVEKKYAKLEKHQKRKSITSLLIFFLLGISSFQIKPTNAYFSDTVVIAGNTFSMASDWMPPVTTLNFSGKSINEKVLNPGFESGLVNWGTQGEVKLKGTETINGITIDPYSGTKMVRVGHTADDGSEIWENKLTQKIQPGAKNLSFYYNFFSYDTAYDDPGMVVRLNDYNVFYLSASDIDQHDSPNQSGWTQLSFDISQITDPLLEIIFYSGNTTDEFDQSWVYIDNVSTAEAVANNGSFTLTANESAQTYYSFDGGPFIGGTAFNLDTITGSTLVRYYSVDAAGNIEGINTRRLVKDTQKPDAIIDLIVTATSKQTVNLSWTSPSDPPNASSSAVYDIRYSLSDITEDNFYDATPSANPPAPRQPGEFQLFEVSGLNSDTLYYFAIKSADAALNWSLTSNSPSDTTLSDALGEDPDINPGDVVINELMWMGTSGSTADEYLELRNMTDRVINISGWQLTKLVSGTEGLMLTIPASTQISEHGYFLIANFDKSTSKINVDPDLVDNDLVLVNDNLQIKLYDGNWTGYHPFPLPSSTQLIDTADNGEGAPAAGQAGTNIYYSMERDATPGKGENADVWHTIFDDSALMHSYWDLDAVEKGTPGGENLSQAVTPAETVLKLSYSDHKVGFTVFNTARFNQLKYTLTYESDSGPQGITGTIDINNQPNLEVKDLFLGICSSGGTCVYHEGVKQINLEVVLSGAIERTLTTSLAL